MKLLFSYTGPLVKDGKGNYYGRTITDDLISRYFSIADEIIMCTRVKKVMDDKQLQNYKKITSENFRVIECPNISSLKGIILERKKAKTIIKNAVIAADIVIARLPDIIGNIAVSFAKEQNKPCLLEVVGCSWDAYWNHSFKGKVLAPFMYYSTKERIKNSDHVVYVTNEFLQKRYHTSGKSIGCSDVKLPPLDGSILINRLNKIENMDKNKPVILGTTGAVDVKYKGQEYVIKAISRLNKDGYNFEYHLAGNGDNSYLKYISEKYGILDKVKFLGTLTHDKVFDYLDNIDIYVQPSKTEGLPRSLVEAMGRGCPAIGSRIGGIPELLNSEFVFNSSAVNEICDLLIKMDKSAMIKEAKRSFEKAKEYDRKLLDRKRSSFYKEFAESVGLVNDKGIACSK